MPEPADEHPPVTGWMARLRYAAPWVVAGVLFLLGLFALQRLLAPVDLDQITAQIAATPLHITGLALLTTLAGYLCLAGYDWSALRYIGKPLPLPVVMTGGLMAYAFGNTIGLTAISGGAVRWRVYAGLGLGGYDIAAISTFAAVSYGVAATLVGLAALALYPTALAMLLPLPPASIRLLALAVIAAMVLPLIWASATGRALRIRRLELRAPSLPILGGQVAISIGDMCFSALTLYLFLPVTDYGFFTFLAVFAAATMAGIISHVPGGIGVFETIIIAAMPAGTPVGPVAAALLLYRLVYYLVPFALALILLSGYEAWRALGRGAPDSRLGRLLSAMEPALRAVAPLAPLVLGAMIFGSGLWMSIAAVLPPMTEAAEAAETLFPLAFVEGSALLSSALGAALIVLSLAVVRRSLGAFWLAVAAMAAGAVVALIHADRQQMMALVLGIVILLPFRRAFRRRAILTHAALTPGWVAMLLAAGAGFGFALFFAHKGTVYANELWWQFAVDERAPRALRAGLLASLMLGVAGLVMLLRAPRIRPEPPAPQDLDAAAAIIADWGSPETSLALTGDKSLMFSDDRRAFVMFAAAGRSWLSYGGPVGPHDAAEEVAFSFADAARRAGASPVFYEIGPQAVPQMLELGMTLHKMGEEAVVSLPEFSLDGAARKRLRAAYARAGREGMVLDLMPPPHDPALIADLRAVSDDWLATRRAREKGFSVGRFDAGWLNRWPLAVVRHQGRIVAFANILTSGGKAAGIDLMRHSASAPPDTMEFLFTALMLRLRDQGYAEFSLGMAPLSGLMPERTGRLWDRFGAVIYRHGGSFYNFAGLRAFKEKFAPDWRPHYLAAPGALPPLIALADAARLISDNAQPSSKAKPTA
ncbi:MAG: bifunctional lysylphosphatidylglycerol flippase/synthetase MprF [Paracoccus sp. (in: a-proteobacteria)]|uniref:bifunctional lysylphosphatidylglycerol flippase/synthetase MprF n=1 Tax=Paracoccus sp. TaxID=267 RepID=UPI0026E0ECEC|nr:bifunctional lysylphosphatidylglycerol flippase/synthetase MprF [Paracoccus sp. (in: a-proteobacteria)]MDO5630618.1 bifunctional lysylphosphatidylglycerol flippase/synthetase MprF [Paracoccus sp. (in: a-proteobacteria)]